MRLPKVSKKSYIILGVAIAVIALVGAGLVFGAKKSPEQLKKETEIKAFVLNGWSIKHIARLEENKGKVLDFKQKLIDYYSAEAGALVEQQRLIDALTAADIAAATDDNSGERVESFKLTGVDFTKEKIGEDSASFTADLEFYIRYVTQAQTYSSFGKNTYKWELRKEKGKWRIVKEELVANESN